MRPGPLRLNASRSGCVLPGNTESFCVELPASASKQTLVVRLKRGGGDPLLMARFGTEPPRVPRRAKILADVWDQQSFDQDAPEHVLSVAVPAGGGPVVLGVHNYTAHKREPCHFSIVATLAAAPATPRDAPTEPPPEPRAADELPTGAPPTVAAPPAAAPPAAASPRAATPRLSGPPPTPGATGFALGSAPILPGSAQIVPGTGLSVADLRLELQLRCRECDLLQDEARRLEAQLEQAAQARGAAQRTAVEQMLGRRRLRSTAAAFGAWGRRAEAERRAAERQEQQQRREEREEEREEGRTQEEEAEHRRGDQQRLVQQQEEALAMLRGQLEAAELRGDEAARRAEEAELRAASQRQQLEAMEEAVVQEQDAAQLAQQQLAAAHEELQLERQKVETLQQKLLHQQQHQQQLQQPPPPPHAGGEGGTTARLDDVLDEELFSLDELSTKIAAAVRARSAAAAAAPPGVAPPRPGPALAAVLAEPTPASPARSPPLEPPAEWTASARPVGLKQQGLAQRMQSMQQQPSKGSPPSRASAKMGPRGGRAVIAPKVGRYSSGEAEPLQA